MLQLQSKLPSQGVTIFSVMTELAQRLNALNLSQGFPDFPAPPALLQALSEATLSGYNQYPAGDGVLTLREHLAKQFFARDQLQLDPLSEITITPGATIAIFCAIQACIHADDEVIIFDPSYDSYAPAVQLAGGKSVHIHLEAPTFQVNWQKVKDSINAKTRMIIVNTPHNPTGAIWFEQDWKQLIELIQDRNIVVLSDEVYEHLVFDGKNIIAPCNFQNFVNVALSSVLLVKPTMSPVGKQVIALPRHNSCVCSAKFTSLPISVAPPLARLRLPTICNNIPSIFRSYPIFIRQNEIYSTNRFKTHVLN